jgi:uncharacterized protein YutD
MGRPRKVKDWESLPHNEIKPKKITKVPIYLTGFHNVTCKYLVIKNKKRNRGVVTYFCEHPKNLKDGSMILSCKGCNLVKH